MVSPILALIILFSTIFWLTHPNFIRQLYLSWKLPGPLALPIVGNAYLYFGVTTVQLYQICNGLVANYGNVFRVWLFDYLVVVFSHPIEVEAILGGTKHLNKNFIYDPMQEWLQTGLLTSQSTKWYRRRKIITPAFHFKILDQFVGVFQKHSTIVVKQLKQYKSTDAVDLGSMVSLFTLDAICEAAMGTCINALTKKEHEYVMAVHTITRNIQTRIFGVQRIDLFYLLGRMRLETNRCLRVVHDFADNVIQKRRAFLLDAPSNYDPDDKRLNNFVDVLLHARTEAGDSLTDLDIREEVDTFIFEGHDTTSSALMFCLYNIARHADVQRKCFEEIRSVVGDDRDAQMTIVQLRSLAYLDAVIKETLRMYPPVPIIGRKIEVETTIGSYTYPAGTNAVVSILSVGRNPDLYEDPDVFRPERFDGRGHTKYEGRNQPFVYVPFSAGPRNCIGQKFAELEIKSLLTRMLRSYELELHADSKTMPAIDVAMIIRPSKPLMYHLKERVYG